MQNLTIQVTEIRSSQQWTNDPDMVSVTIPADFFDKAAQCLSFMQETDVSIMTFWWAFGYELYAVADKDQKFIIGDDGNEYAIFTPNYCVDGCHAKVFKDGIIRAVLPFKNSPDEIWFDVGRFDDLKAKGCGVPVASAVASTDMPIVCQRLLDPKEYIEGQKVPAVAQDAVKEIQRLKTALKATQSAHSQAMQYAEKADQFVAQTAALSIWGHDRNDGTPYDECDESAEGHADSHECLMNLIEAARNVQEVV